MGMSTNVSQYYKPWQLRPDDHAIIQDQIEDAEATISREVAEFEARYPPQEHSEQKDQEQKEQKEQKGQQEHKEQQEQQEQTQKANPESAPENRTEAETDAKEKETTQASHTVDTESQHEKGTKEAPIDVPQDHNASVHEHSDVHRGHEDDGGEVVEDQEDTVIY